MDFMTATDLFKMFYKPKISSNNFLILLTKFIPWYTKYSHALLNPQWTDLISAGDNHQKFKAGKKYLEKFTHSEMIFHHCDRIRTDKTKKTNDNSNIEPNKSVAVMTPIQMYRMAMAYHFGCLSLFFLLI